MFFLPYLLVYVVGVGLLKSAISLWWKNTCQSANIPTALMELKTHPEDGYNITNVITV